MCIRDRESTRAGGSGLGLFVVRTTMDNHRGRARFGRSAQGGALVSLHFPESHLPSSSDPTRGD